MTLGQGIDINMNFIESINSYAITLFPICSPDKRTIRCFCALHDCRFNGKNCFIWAVQINDHKHSLWASNVNALLPKNNDKMNMGNHLNGVVSGNKQPHVNEIFPHLGRVITPKPCVCLGREICMRIQEEVLCIHQPWHMFTLVARRSQ